MSRIEQSMEKALKLRDQSSPSNKNAPLPPSTYIEPYHTEEKQVHLRDYLEILLRRKSIIMVFFIALVTTVTVASFLMTPLYKAQSTIQLNIAETELVTFRDVYRERQGLETQYNILKSKNLAERVASKIPLEQSPERPENGVLTWIKNIFSRMPEEGVQKPVSPVSAGTILKGLDILPIKETNLVNVNFISKDPVFAATAANAVADAYVVFTQESKLKPTQVGGERLRKEVDDMRIKLETSEKELNEYIAKSQFIFTINDKDYNNILAQKLSKLNSALDDATSERISKEATYLEARRTGVDYNFILQSPLMQNLTQDYIELESEYFKLLMTHKPEHPRMVRLKNQIEQQKSRIEIEEQKIIDSVHSDYKLALKKENLLSSSIHELRQNVNVFQQSMIQFLTLKREVETNRGIYDSLLQRLKEVDISAALTESNVQILDRAQVPRQPYKPNKGYNIVLSVIFGLFGGVFLAFFIEYFDNTVKTGEDVEKLTHLPLLGKVPLAQTTLNNLADMNSQDNAAFIEAFRSISARIRFANLPKQIVITSPMEQEGKTIISLSVAMSLISSKEKGIIIDADLRRPDVHSIFDLDNSVGLSSYLSGTSGFDEGLIKQSPYAGLDAITAGPVPPNPSELLNSGRMRELIDALSAAYDYIIFDSAPVLAMSDSLILSTFADGVILIVKSGSTPEDALKQTDKALHSVNARMLGVILNGVNNNAKYTSSAYYCSPYLNNNGKSKNGNRKKLV